jgi:hypothetical protein
VAFLALATIFLASPFLVGATAKTYDPWVDLNQDGKIDIFDVVELTERYGTVGTPVNRTELLLERAGWFPAPAFDSGWMTLGLGMNEIITLAHNLNTTNVFVYLVGSANLNEIHQGNYGFNYYPFLAEGGELGSRWYRLNATCVKLVRGNIDAYSPSVAWNYVRVMIWKIATP